MELADRQRHMEPENITRPYSNQLYSLDPHSAILDIHIYHRISA